MWWSPGLAICWGLKGILVNFVLRVVKKMVPRFELPGYVGFNDALSIGAKSNFVLHKGAPDDTIVLQYTGGTTGVSKGAMLTNHNLLSNMYQIKSGAGSSPARGT